MALRNGKVGDFLTFERLDRADHLVQVLCLGYRFTDDSSERWTAFVNRVKNNQDGAVGRAEDVLRTAVSGIQFPNKPVIVVAILGSGDTSTRQGSAVPRLAASVGSLDGYVYCPTLLRKERHRSLHGLRSAASRDAEVDGKYRSARFRDIGIQRVGCVLLVDDLVTRGTTMNDAARSIRETNGNVPVFGVALGKTDRRSYWGDRISNDHVSAALLKRAGLE
jgi:hypothetical protein